MAQAMRLSPLDGAAASLAAAGLLGAAVHASQLYSPSLPSGGAPPALGVLLASLTSYFALEALWWARSGGSPTRSERGSACRLGGARLALGTVPALFILYLVGFRLDGALWCTPLGAAVALYFAGVTQYERGGRRKKGGETAATAPAAGGGAGEGAEEGCYSPVAGESAAAPPSSPSVPCARCPPCCVPPPGSSTARKALFVAHGAVWGCATLTLLLLLAGAFTIAYGWHAYPRRGTLYTVHLDGGRVQTLHALCTGPRNASLPTFWLETGGGGHSMSDTWGLQFALNARGRRACSYDPPGTGWSRLEVGADWEDKGGDAALTAGLMASMDEPGPFIMLGTQDGGAVRIYSLALVRPDLVAALVPMQLGEGEFYDRALFNNWSPEQAATHAAAVLRSRLSAGDVIRFVGVHWGIVPMAVGSSPRFVPPERQAESHFLNLFHEGQWDMQCRYLAAQVRDPAGTVLQTPLWTSDRSLSPLIPVLALDNTPQDGGVAACAQAQYAPDGPDCRLLRFSIARQKAFMTAMTVMSAGSAYRNCEGALGASACAADWLGTGGTLPFVTAAIFDQLGNLTSGR